MTDGKISAIAKRRGRGKGKKPAMTTKITIRATHEDVKRFIGLGGSKWFRRILREGK